MTGPMSMTDEKEIEQRRLAEKKAYRLTLTGDVGALMEALKRQSPEAWQSYIATVRQEGTIEDETYSTILKTAFALFPGRGTQEIVDLLRRMLDMVREEFGMENGGEK
jgi:hypothetical protein